MAKKTKEQAAPETFEEALLELEQIVKGMEDNVLSLEESLKSYERGVFLSKICQEKLDNANQQILVLQNNLLHPIIDTEAKGISSNAVDIDTYDEEEYEHDIEIDEDVPF